LVADVHGEAGFGYSSCLVEECDCFSHWISVAVGYVGILHGRATLGAWC
jgi:hypothetical protein